ncbi:hypothetical protein HMPREF9333_01052 [Johnsonella ignava ATCC 51276]|uniref:Uncharacterized protein n=1 Tax=Johnsonella ignava ATCC 51276 TaxID=679200 RepID=G5GHL2_9FIRM|nr:hypothetical protein [Johnsonella ignava]EHI55705.1 hypothetical protein HMPREF9333_01052 [Johnsonella ignava ATCC 51276]
MDKKGRMIRLFIFWGIVTLVCIISYSIYRYRIHLQNIRYMRNEDSIEFLYDGLRKYELQQATEAKLEYISADGSIFYFDNETMLVDKCNEVSDKYIRGELKVLGQFKLTEGENTARKIEIFNDNMSHIKIWNEPEKRYKTISENEGLEEFKEIRNLDELYRYMYKKSEFNVLYIDELNIIGHDRTAQFTKFIYDYGNGEEKVIKEYGRISFRKLFEVL